MSSEGFQIINEQTTNAVYLLERSIKQQRHRSARKKRLSGGKTKKQLFQGTDGNDPFALRDEGRTQEKEAAGYDSVRGSRGRWRPAPTGQRHQVVVDDVEPRALPREKLKEGSNQTQTMKAQTRVKALKSGAAQLTCSIVASWSSFRFSV